MNSLQECILYLLSAVVSVPIFRRLGLGSVLGYLFAGTLIGPSGLGLVSDVDAVFGFGELGVVLLLFILGLELQPKRLWSLRRVVFGVGGAQVVLCAVLGAYLAHAVGLGGVEATLVGVGLSLSSTAFSLQLLGERNQLATPHGQTAFGILLFQDLAVIIVLAALPVMLGGGSVAHPVGTTVWRALLMALGVLGCRVILTPLLRRVAGEAAHELFTAAALLVVMSMAWLAECVGLSLGLGAFLAGVLFADSQYRHALEADIEPFKGLLLGLFFMAVGMSLNLQAVWGAPLTVVGTVAALFIVKTAVLYAIGRFVLKGPDAAWHLALALGQGGEFAFVIFGQSVKLLAMSEAHRDLLVASVTLSMAVTPVLFMGYERFVMARLGKKGRDRAFDVAPSHDTPVIIVGFGRMGQVVGRILAAKGITFTALDNSAAQIDFVRQFGNRVFYGDASRVDLLRAARADKAQTFVCTIGDIEPSLACVRCVQAHFPHLKIVARARNRVHAYRLMHLKVDYVIRETLYSSLRMTSHVLEDLGLPFGEAQAAVDRFLEHDETLMQAGAKAQTHAEQVELATQGRLELRSLFVGPGAVENKDA